MSNKDYKRSALRFILGYGIMIGRYTVPVKIYVNLNPDFLFQKLNGSYIHFDARLGLIYYFGPKRKIYVSKGADLSMEFFYRGIVAYQNKDYELAIKYFERVLEIRYDPTADYYLKNTEMYLKEKKNNNNLLQD